jgi:hypothetical protein
MAELKETKGKFKVVGKVSRIDRDGAFKESIMDNQNNKNHGRTYRALRFGVKTSDTNEIFVGCFDYEPEEVFMWNSEMKKADPSYKGTRVPLGDWEMNKSKYKEDGYAVLQSRIGLDWKDDGKLDTEGLPRYITSKLLYDNLNNGDPVAVEGTVRYSEYQNQQGQTVKRKDYTIEKVFRLKKLDFDSEDFNEVSYFEQEVVYVDVDIDKKEKKAYLTGRVIDYFKNFVDMDFVVNFGTEDGGNDPDMVKLAEALAKKVKFGDVINVYGNAVNKMIVTEEEDDEVDEADELIKSLGGKSKPKHAQGYVARTYITEMEIEGIDAWDEKVYSEDDFIKKETIENSKSGLGGKKKADPFANLDDDDGIEDVSDDELPF